MRPVSRGVFLIVVVCLFCLANATRWGYRSRIGHPRFVAEGAAHLRYTEMVAGGRAVPAIDFKAQYPEGLAVYRETSIAMEYLYGGVYRLLCGARVDIVRFIRFFTAFLFSLAIFPVASIAAGLWRSRRAGILSAVLFAVTVPLVARSSGFEFIRENVTFPLLVFHVYFLASACESKRWRDACLSGLFAALALSSWQGTQFYLVAILAFLLVRRVVAVVDTGERRAAWMLVLFSLVAGVAVPFLRRGGYLLSLPVGLSASWIAADIVSALARRGDRGGEARRSDGSAVKAAAAAAGLACILLPALLSREHFASYSHFFRLVLYKLRYVYKPEDPGLLPFDVRAFWVGPFHSPDPLHFFVFALPVVLVIPGPVDRLIRRSRAGEFRPLLVLTFLAVFFALFLLIQRLLPLFGIFAVIVGGGNAAGGISVGSAPGGSPAAKGGDGGGARGAQRRLGASAGLIVTFAVIAISLVQDFAWEGRADVWRHAARALRIPRRERFVVYPYERDVEESMLRWIEGRTPERSIVLTLHYLSPQVLTYTGRTTNLNDFFESARLRRKAERFLTALYGSEDRLYAFCREQGSDYLLLSIAVSCDPTSDSPLYQAGQTGIRRNSAAYRLMFEPRMLSAFDLVYENEMYRIFKVGQSTADRKWPRSPLFYEDELLWRYDGDIRSFYNAVMHIYALTAQGRSLLRREREREAETALVDALRVYYFYPAWRLLADLYRSRGRFEELASLSEFAYERDPYRIDVCIELVRSTIETGEIERAREVLAACASLDATGRQRAEMDRLRRRLGLPSQ